MKPTAHHLSGLVLRLNELWNERASTEQIADQLALCRCIAEHIMSSPEPGSGAPGATDAERAAWLADKLAGNGYCAEAGAMLRRWPDDGRAPRTRDHRALPDEMTHYPATVCACGAGALGMGHAPECPVDAYARQLASASGRAEPDDLDREAARIMALPEDRVDDELRALGIDPATAAQKGRDAVAGALAQAEAHRARCGGYVCGMCGQDTPHQHTPEEVVIFRNGIKRGTYGVPMPEPQQKEVGK